MAWYSSWFGRDYLRIYEHRDQAEAEQQAEFILRVLEPRPKRLLDVACGNGRHLLSFKRRGICAVGVDLSLELLRASVSDTLSRIRADMRSLPFPSGAFDALTSMFTSFGYFESDKEHESLLREWRRVLKSQSTLVIDYLNRPYVEAHLRETEERTVEQYRVAIRRQIIGRRVVKQIALHDPSTAEPRVFEESVLMYTREELATLLERSGFHVLSEFGDFDGARPSPRAKRLIVVAQAGAA